MLISAVKFTRRKFVAWDVQTTVMVKQSYLPAWRFYSLLTTFYGDMIIALIDLGSQIISLPNILKRLKHSAMLPSLQQKNLQWSEIR